MRTKKKAPETPDTNALDVARPEHQPTLSKRRFYFTTENNHETRRCFLAKENFICT